MNGNLKKTPLVSIIMNCFNGEKFLKETLETVLSQSYSNWELIFWDNQSNDSSSLIVKNISDDRIKYFFAQNHTKLGAARNLAVQQAKGEWLAFLDCDDLWEKDKLKLQIERALVEHNISMVYGRTEYFSEGGLAYTNITRKTLPEGDIFGELAKDNFISLSSAMVLREKYILVNGIEQNYNQAEDYDLFVKLSVDSKIGVVDQSVMKYRLHENNLSAFQKDLAFTESIEILEKYLPDRRAVIGLKHWTSLYVIFCISRMKITKDALYYFLKYGSVLILFKKSIELINLKIG